MAHKIRYDNKLLKLMSFFEAITRTKLKDCFFDANDVLVFVVEPAQLGLAIGRDGSNVKRLEITIKKRVKLVEYSDDIISFIRGLIQPIKARDIVLNYGVVTIMLNSENSTDKGRLIGRGGKNLRNYEAILRRYFPIKEVKVL